MSEPTWELLGGGGVLGPAGIDYVGAWAAGTTYQPGQVVRYGGVDYLAVNPSLGQTPPVSSPLFGGVATTLPSSPSDGMEAILVDSLTAPTYFWRFRYMASSSSAYKWMYVGGSPWQAYSGTSVALSAGGAWNFLTGMDFITPRAGDYICELVARIGVATANQQCAMGICNASVSSTPVGMQTWVYVGNYDTGAVLTTLPGVGAGNTLRPVASAGAAAGTAADLRTFRITPVRVA